MISPHMWEGNDGGRISNPAWAPLGLYIFSTIFGGEMNANILVKKKEEEKKEIMPSTEYCCY